MSKENIVPTPPHGAYEKPGGTFINPSAPGPTTKAHEAKEGVVTNPGVRKVSTEISGPRCPMCGGNTLKMRMNRPAGKRVYCSNKSCRYDQTETPGPNGLKTNPETKVVSSTSQGSKGVTIIRQSRMG